MKNKHVWSGGKIRRILNSSEKVFYGGDTKFSFSGYECMEKEVVKIDKHTQHRMCGHGGERMVKVWVLIDKGKKITWIFPS